MTRLYQVVITLFTFAILFTACGGRPIAEEVLAPTEEGVADSEEAEAKESSAESSEASASADIAPVSATADAGFPVVIDHKFGSTEITTEPERIVSLGYTDQDPILALGETPLAIRYFFGNEDAQIWPWAQDELGDSTPQILNMPFENLNFEAITSLQPDLIISVSAGITDEEYEILSQIAPTVAQSADYIDFGTPWQEQTQVIGRALGKEMLANELIMEIEERFIQTREEYPEFIGATAVIVAPTADGQFYISGPQHERQRFLTSLGFDLPDALAEIAGDEFYGIISGERLDLIDTDVVIWTVSPEQRAIIEDNPLYQQLSVAQEKRAIFLDTSGEGELVGPALVYSSLLSLPVVFDELVPQLADALEDKN